MKKKFLFILLLFLKLSVFAQFEVYINAGNFKIEYTADYCVVYPSIIETVNEQYIFSAPYKIYYTSSCETPIFLLNEDGVLINDTYIDSSIIKTKCMGVQSLNEKLVMYGWLPNSNENIDSDKIPILLELDDNLNIISIDTLPLFFHGTGSNYMNNAPVILPTNGYVNESESLVLYNFRNLMIYEVDTTTREIIKQKTFGVDMSGIQSFQHLLDGRHIVLMKYRYSLQHQVYQERIWSLDVNYNLLHNDTIEELIPEATHNILYNGLFPTIKIIDNTHFLYSYHHHYWNLDLDLNKSYFQHEVALLEIKDDHSFEFIKKVILQEDDSIHMQINRQNSLVFSDKNNIFVTSTTKIVEFHALTPEYPNSIMLTRLDSNLNIKSQYFYGNDGAYYLALDSKATEDGGCVIASWRYTLDENNEIDTSQFYILKVNEEGTLGNGSNTEDISSRMKQAIIYPNPVKDAFTIRYGQHLKDVKIELFNMNGQQVLDKNLTNNLTKINIENLSSGTYIYHIISENKIIEKDKLIKK